MTAPTLYRIEVGLREELPDPAAHALSAQFRSLGLPAPARARTVRLHWVEAAISREQAQRLGAELFADPITENVIPGPGTTLVAPICSDQQNRYRLALPFAYVGLLAGGVFLVTGLGLVLGAPSAPEDDTAAPTVSVMLFNRTSATTDRGCLLKT